jgi:hypothetical protein
MKNLFLILSMMLLFSSLGIAQTKNINVDNLRFSFTYRKSPSEPRDTLLTTIFAKFIFTSTSRIK